MTPYEDKTLKDSLQEEKQKLKSMSIRDRLWYIWEYYKIPILSITAALFLIGSIGSAMYQNRFETALSCFILNSRPGSDTDRLTPYFDQDFRQYAGLSEDVKVEVDSSMNLTFDESAMSELTYASLAKVTAVISTKDLDIMIGTPETASHYGSLGGFADLKEFLPADVYEKVKDRLYMTTNEETGETIATGILIGETDFCDRTGLIMEEPVLSVIGNSTRTDTSLKLVRYVLGL
ncbi:MAG: hypothetical protein QM657_04015 [Lacrimispora sp.]|uniref:hypothetical protein n=1 Tax=Lacrimispora sp. TaxID=2719234 RepID=UPI0039E60CD3